MPGDAVDDMGLVHPVLDCPDAGLELGTHAGARGTGPDQPLPLSMMVVTGRRCTRTSPPSMPDNPTPRPPCLCSAESSSVLILPAKTILATSRAASSVTRRPPTSWGWKPRVSESSLAWGPPP